MVLTWLVFVESHAHVITIAPIFYILKYFIGVTVGNDLSILPSQYNLPNVALTIFAGTFVFLDMSAQVIFPSNAPKTMPSFFDKTVLHLASHYPFLNGSLFDVLWWLCFLIGCQQRVLFHYLLLATPDGLRIYQFLVDWDFQSHSRAKVVVVMPVCKYKLLVWVVSKFGNFFQEIFYFLMDCLKLLYDWDVILKWFFLFVSLKGILITCTLQ